ncbi:MAG: hypothetical protein MUC88_00105 [Planctomycetes bacterium]|jgi:hypothetical protein|nr:hypothetical protein [Planctomycetota bacterium]
MAPEYPVSPEIPFRIDIPIEVWHKAGEPGKERRIGGVISTEHEDKQGEVVLQRGLEFSDFIRNGWLNDNHSRDTAGVVGYPLKVERTVVDGKPATRMEGYLLAGTTQADKLWELAQALQQTDRRLGFSIEGKVLRRSGDDGRTIASARVTNVAVTNCPVNTKTGLDVLAKSMLAVEKMLTAGAAISPPATPTPGDGFALRTESLEGVSSPSRPQKKKRKRRLTKAEAMRVIHERHPHITGRAAERIWRFAARMTRKGA